jgi:hypothetical protein
MILPLAICMKKRPKDHYMDVNNRVQSIAGRYILNEPTVCLTEQLFGIIGAARHLDTEKHLVKFDIDKEGEESKL